MPCSQRSRSFSLTTFSPSGKLVQIEYALKAVAAGATSLGICSSDGVVIATEKKLPSILVDESTVQKICLITPNIGVVYSGMGPDYRVLIRKARKTAQAYHSLYKEHIPVAQLVREVATVMQEFTRESYHHAHYVCIAALLSIKFNCCMCGYVHASVHTPDCAFEHSHLFKTLSPGHPLEVSKPVSKSFMQIRQACIHR